MKINKIYIKTVLIIVALSFYFSCVKDNDFKTPEVTIEEPNITTNATVSKIQTDLIQEYNVSGSLTYTYRENDVPTYVTGYVVSNDSAGNFYQKLIVQDAFENPTAGVEFLINSSSLGQTYEVGRKVYIKLDGLTVTYNDGQSDARSNPTDAIAGKFSVGIINHTGQVANIPSTTYREYIIKSSTVEEIIPNPVKLYNIEQKHVNTLIQLNNIQFDKNELNKTFSDEKNDAYDGFRTLFECETEETLLLQTSTFSSFSSNKIPKGIGSANVILSKDFYADFFVAILSSPTDLNFSNDTRCDPTFLNCNAQNLKGSMVVYSENFDEISSTAKLTSEKGWTNVNVNNGSKKFSLSTYNGSKCLKISAYDTNENPFEVWAVSPTINLDASVNEVLTFTTLTTHNKGLPLSVWVSSDFNGDVKTATWQRLDAVISGESNYISSGAINISCLSGDIHIAFKYLGGDGGITTTVQIDDIKITGDLI